MIRDRELFTVHRNTDGLSGTSPNIAERIILLANLVHFRRKTWLTIFFVPSFGAEDATHFAVQIARGSYLNLSILFHSSERTIMARWKREAAYAVLMEEAILLSALEFWPQ